MNQNSEILIFNATDGKIKLQAKLEDGTVWLTQEQIAHLFGKGRTTITECIGNIFEEIKLNEKKFVGISDRTLNMVLLREKHKLKK